MPRPAPRTIVNPALKAAACGLAVIPLSRTKLPAVRSPHRAQRRPARCRGECGQIGHGIHDATTDPDAIRTLFAAAPWATGYGIACGTPPHHLIGVDLDVKNDVDGIANFQRLTHDHGFTVPATVSVTTPSGGLHLWLRGPAGRTVPNSAGRLAPGIDVRGSGGYLVGPGSITVRGQYVRTPGTERHPIVEAPDALLLLLAPAVPPRTLSPALPVSGRQAIALVQFVLDAPDGQRNDRLYWAACRARETDQGPSLAQALVDAAVHIGLSENEARATVTSAARGRR
ncbi:DNA primase [Streptomyces sp. ERV7]|uniref:bifunctional DNA primase/polymerase n=1 Tax=Streptomyces sp. ERV7 TaxID=1322334 RepID=UPI0007F42BE2|nr:bifunctional DNA primase/polymerase [Streptomyces sp. ERV7]OAR24313.1 DNA primase [Streptomyces sp. ERV7]